MAYNLAMMYVYLTLKNIKRNKMVERSDEEKLINCKENTIGCHKRNKQINHG